MADADPSKSKDKAPPAPTEAPKLTLDERLAQVRAMPAGMERASAFGDVFKQVSKQEAAREVDRKKAYDERLKKLRARDPDVQAAVRAQRRAASPDRETNILASTKAKGIKMMQSDFGVYLKKVADKRGVDFDDVDQRAQLIDGLIQGAMRPTSEGYDSNIFIYDKDKEGFDTDAMQAVNIWSMATLGQQYKSPQELRENLPEDYQELLRQQRNLDLLQAQEIADRGGERVSGLIDGKVVSVDRTKNSDLNARIARTKVQGAEQTLFLADLDEVTKNALREAHAAVPDKASMDEAGLSKAAQRRVVALHQMRDPTRPQDLLLGLTQSADGQTALDLKAEYDSLYSARFRAIRQQRPELSRSAALEMARDDANRVVQKIVNNRAPTYHPDPEGAFAAYTRGEGFLGNVSDGLQIMASVATFGVDELAGDFLDKMIKAGLAPLLPPVKVAGTLKEATGETVRAGEFGFVSRYLSDNATTRGIDQALRVSAVSEGLSAAYAMALEEVLDEKGSFDGEIMDLAKKTLKNYGTDEHLFRVASRDDDMGTMMFTIGRAADPTVALGLRDAPDADSVFNLATVTGATAMIFGLMFEPDALTLLGPGGHLVSKGAKLTTALTGLDTVAAFGRAARRVKYDAQEGIDAFRRLRERQASGAITEEKAAEELGQMAYMDADGKVAAVTRIAEMGAARKAGVAAPSPGQVPSEAKNVIGAMREAEGAYKKAASDAEDVIQKMDKKLAKAPDEVRQIADDILAHQKARDAELNATSSRDMMRQRKVAAEARLKYLEDAKQKKVTVDDQVRKGLAERLQKTDLEDDAARISFLDDAAVKKVIEAAGEDPVEMLARAQALKQGGTARGIQREKSLRAFAKKTQTMLAASLARPFDDLLDESIAAAKADVQKADAALTVDMATLNKNSAAARTLEARIASNINALGGAAKASPEVDGMLSSLSEGYRIFAEQAKKRAVAIETLRQEELKLAGAAPKRRTFIQDTLDNIIEMLEVAEKIGQASAKARLEFGDVLKTARKEIGDTEGTSYATFRRAEKALRQDESVTKMLDNMRSNMTTDEYIAAVESLLSNQLAIRQFYKEPGGVGALVRAQPSIRGIENFVDGLMMKTARFTAKYQGALERFADTYLTVERGVLDIEANEKIGRASIAARIYARTVGGELQEYIMYSERIGKEAPDVFNKLSRTEQAQVKYERAVRLFLEFMEGTGTIDMKTTARQTVSLSGRVGSTSPLDHAVDYLVDAARITLRGEPDEVIAALVRSFARDKINIADLPKAENLATRRVCSYIERAVAAGVGSRELVENLPQVIRKSWNDVLADSGSPIAKQLSDYRLLTKILTIAAAESRMLKQVAGTAGAQKHLFSPAQARNINNFSSEGLSISADLPTKPLVGDLVITKKAAAEFNKSLNSGRIVPGAPDVDILGYKLMDSPSRGTLGGFPRDPSIPSRKPTQREISSDVRDLKGGEPFTGVGMRRDVGTERAVGAETGIIAYRVDEIVVQKGKEIARLVDLEGNYVMMKPVTDLAMRDPLVGSLQDAMDGILALGLSFTAGRQKNAAVAAAGEVKRQYSKLVARSIDADGNVLYVPRDLSKDLYDAIDGLKKDLVDPPVQGLIAQRLQGLVGKLISWHKQAILFGLIIPRAAFGTNAIYGDTTQMIIDLNDVPLSSVLRVSLYGAMGYIPGVGRGLQRSFGALGGKGLKGLPSPSHVLSDPATRAVLAGSNEFIEVRRGGKIIKERASDILAKAHDQSAFDNILTSDSMLALRKVQQDPAFGGKLRDYRRLLEIQMREATKAQRVGLFLNLYAEQGMTAEKAGLRMRQALFNWDDSIGSSEAIFLGRNFLFYTFIKNAFAQAHRTLFEGYTDDLDVHLKKFLTGRTKLQRLELVSRFTKDFFVGAFGAGETEVIETPEEAQRRAYASFIPDYMLEQATLFTMPVGTDQTRVIKAIYGPDIDSVAGILPKATHIEFLNNYLDIVNHSMIPLAVTALNAMGLTEREVNYDAVMQGLLRHAVDVANPFSAEVIKGFAGVAGIEDPQAGFGGASGPKVRQYEAVMLTHFGMGDALEIQDDGTLRINPDSTSGLMSRALGGSMVTSLMRQFVLPEYTRARLLDELAGGYVAGEGSLLLFQQLSKGIPGVNPFDEVDAARIKAGPMSIEYTEAQRGFLAARVQAFSELLGAYKHAFYSGRLAQTYDINDKKQLGSTVVSQAQKRGKPKRPIPSVLPKDE